MLWLQARTRACIVLKIFLTHRVIVDAHVSTRTRYAADGGGGMRWGEWCKRRDAVGWGSVRMALSACASHMGMLSHAGSRCGV